MTTPTYRRGSSPADGGAAVAVTVGHLHCSTAEAWSHVCFYEHILKQPSWLLRTVLPVPLRSTGCYGSVGDTSRCQYSDGGYLTKRITKRQERKCIEFDVIEHSIRYCNRIALRGGAINVIAEADGTCRIEMVTRYELLVVWLWPIRYFIERTISLMHALVIEDMRERVQAARPRAAPLAASRLNDRSSAGSNGVAT